MSATTYSDEESAGPQGRRGGAISQMTVDTTVVCQA